VQVNSLSRLDVRVLLDGHDQKPPEFLAANVPDPELSRAFEGLVDE
jgi:hypothetical protein